MGPVRSDRPCRRRRLRRAPRVPVHRLRHLRVRRHRRVERRRLRSLSRRASPRCARASRSAARRSSASRRSASGPSTIKRIVPPPKDQVYTEMEALIQHFLIYSQGFTVPAGDAYVPVEGAARRAWLLCRVGRHQSSVARAHARARDCMACQALHKFIVGGHDRGRHRGDRLARRGDGRRGSMSFHPAMPYGTEQWHRSQRATLPEGPEFAYTAATAREFRRVRLALRARASQVGGPARALSGRRSSRATSRNNAARHVAEVIGCTTAEVEDVVSYYVMFLRNPVGKYVLQVCTTLSCALAGAERVIEELQHKLGIKAGETDPTGMFTIQPMECLGACDRAPVMMVNNDHWHERLQPEQVGASRRSHRRPTGSRRSTAATSRSSTERDQRRARRRRRRKPKAHAGLRAGAHEVRVHARRRHARSLPARTSRATRA